MTDGDVIKRAELVYLETFHYGLARHVGGGVTSVLSKLELYCELALFMNANERSGVVLGAFGAMLLHDKADVSDEGTSAEQLREIVDTLSLAETCQSDRGAAVTAFVARWLLSSMGASTERRGEKRDRLLEAMLPVLSRGAFPVLAAEKLLQQLVSPANLVTIEAYVTEPALMGIPPLARVMLLHFEREATTSTGQTPELPLCPQLTRLRRLAAARVALAELQVEMRQILRVEGGASAAPTAMVRKAVTAVDRFVVAADALGSDTETVKAWALDQLDNTFGRASLRKNLLMGKVKRHLLVPELMTELQVHSETDDLGLLPFFGNTYLNCIKSLSSGLADVSTIQRELKEHLEKHPYPGVVICTAAVTVAQDWHLPRRLPRSLRDCGLLDKNEEELLECIASSTGRANQFLGVDLKRGRIRQPDVERIVVLCLAGALAMSRGNENRSHTLRILTTMPGYFRDCYLWAGLSDKYNDAQLEMQKVREPNVSNLSRQPIYECPNGHVYWLTNCSRPWFEFPCSTCGAKIGGKLHKEAPGNICIHRSKWKIPKMGYNLNNLAVQTSRLTPASYFPLRFWTHALLLGPAACFGKESKVSALELLPKRYPKTMDPPHEFILEQCFDAMERGLQESKLSRSDGVKKLLVVFSDLAALSSLWEPFRAPSDFESLETMEAFEMGWRSMVEQSASLEQRSASLEQTQESQLALSSFVAQGMLDAPQTFPLLVFPAAADLDNLSAETDSLAETLLQRRAACPTFWHLSHSWQQLLYCAQLPDLIEIPRLLFTFYGGGRLSMVEAMRMPLREALGPRCAELWGRFARAWNFSRVQLQRVECAAVTLETLQEDVPFETLEMFVCLDRDYGLQLWNLVETLAGYQNRFIEKANLAVEAVHVLDFERRFAVAVDSGTGSKVAGAISQADWLSQAVLCGTQVGNCGVSFEVLPFEVAARRVVAPLRQIIVDRPTFEVAEVRADSWHERLEEIVPAAELPLKVIGYGKRLPQDELAALLNFVTKCVHQLLGGVKAAPQTLLVDFADRVTGQQTTAVGLLRGDLAELRLEHLVAFRDMLFESYEPDLAAMTHVVYQAQWTAEGSLSDDEAVWELWTSLARWSDLHSLYLHMKSLLVYRLYEETPLAPTSPLCHTLYAHVVAASPGAEICDMLFDRSLFPQSLELRFALTATEIARSVVQGEEMPAAVKRHMERVKEQEAADEERRQREEAEQQALVEQTHRADIWHASLTRLPGWSRLPACFRGAALALCCGPCLSRPLRVAIVDRGGGRNRARVAGQTGEGRNAADAAAAADALAQLNFAGAYDWDYQDDRWWA
eukprot:TRINITY_DN25190_c0_g2_i1.p1 TRINITY_DN25190_c0_g2~~TRINITY_DN25190_c0_g2_i1.p1  ORF type:complete len:1347 (+),score=227.73 TRINITY_DN25190_c0_g2_i1:95-4042(+)